jgi:hypothetical protein
MGFLDYAWSISLQKDKLKTRIRIDQSGQQPILETEPDRYNITLPVPTVSEEGTISFLGSQFPHDLAGEAKVGRLFRACVFHLTAHTLTPPSTENRTQIKPRHTPLETFSESLVKDVYVNAMISMRYPNAIVDLAFATLLAFAKMKPVERIYNPSTRMMAALLMKINSGVIKGELREDEKSEFNHAVNELNSLKEQVINLVNEEKNEVDEVLHEATKKIITTLEPHGPFIEFPSLPYTEKTGPSSIFSHNEMAPLSQSENERVFKSSLEILGWPHPSDEPMESYWKEESAVEASQVFDTWVQEKAREEKILTKLKSHIEPTRFKSVGFPDEDYSQYLAARRLISGGSRRLLDSLRVAQDALDEDPGKEIGQLDLTAVIQVIASQKPATDVFMQDEYLSRSFAWGILFDTSASIRTKGEFARALAICVAEAAKELLMDAGSWAFFAFNDRFYILKDSSESYSEKVRSRIGGLKFEGLSYLPDAIRVAGNIVSKRYDEQRFLIVISDGYPYGYQGIEAALSEEINSLQKKGVIIVGIGLETDKMKDYFKLNAPVYTQRDIIKKFARIYLNASTAQLES